MPVKSLSYDTAVPILILSTHYAIISSTPKDTEYVVSRVRLCTVMYFRNPWGALPRVAGRPTPSGQQGKASRQNAPVLRPLVQTATSRGQILKLSSKAASYTLRSTSFVL